MCIRDRDNGEQALEIAETMVRSGAIDIVVVDSVAALVPKAEIEGDMGDSPVSYTHLDVYKRQHLLRYSICARQLPIDSDGFPRA